jgi:hypothetical protein
MFINQKIFGVVTITVTLAGILLYGFYYYGLSCFAGGGGSNHTPPQVFFGQETKLDFEMVISAAPQCISKKNANNYKNVSCYYSIETPPDRYIKIVPEVIKDDNGRTQYQCTIPAISKSEDHKDIKLHYYFELTWNGQYNRRNENPIEIIYSNSPQ